MSDGWFPQLTPAGVLVCAGSRIVSVNGQPIAPINGDLQPWGAQPVWVRTSTTIAQENALLYTFSKDGHPLDGQLMSAYAPHFQATWMQRRSGNVLTAGGGRFAIWRPDIGIEFDDQTRWAGYRDPAWDETGAWFACLAPTGELLIGPPAQLMTVLGPGGHAVRDARELAWRSGLLTWTSGPLVYYSDTSAKATDLSLPQQDQEGHPVAVATPVGFWLLSHVTRNNQSRVILRRFGATRGIVVYDGDTDAPHDARWLDAAQAIRVVWSGGGTPMEQRYPLSTPLVDLIDPAPPEPLPIPPDPEDNMVPISESTFLAIPQDLRLGSLTRFRNEACWERDRLECAADQVTGGAAALYFWPAYLGTIGTLVQNGQAPDSQGWTNADQRGYDAACRSYWAAQGNPNGTPPAGDFSGPIDTAGRDFTS